MCRITMCCMCCGLRVGTYLAAAYTITLGLIGAIIAGVGGGLSSAAKKFISDSSSSDENKEAANTGLTIAEIIFYVTMAIYLLWVITAIFLIIGAAKSKRGYLIPWIVMTIILTIFAAIAILIGLINISVTFGSAASALNFIIQVTLFILNIYSLVAVMSFYKDNCVDREVTGKQVV